MRKLNMKQRTLLSNVPRVTPAVISQLESLNDYETLNFNTAISQMMIFINAVYKEDVFPKEYAEGFVKLLNPVAPHITSEMYEIVFGGDIINDSWLWRNFSNFIIKFFTDTTC